MTSYGGVCPIHGGPLAEGHHEKGGLRSQSIHMINIAPNSLKKPLVCPSPTVSGVQQNRSKA